MGEVGASVLLRLRIYLGKSACRVRILFLCITVHYVYLYVDFHSEHGKNAEVILVCGLESSSPVQQFSPGAYREKRWSVRLSVGEVIYYPNMVTLS